MTMKVLAYTSPARGHLYPVVPILDELRDRGHEVAVRTLGSQVAMLRKRGVSAEPIAGAIEDMPHDDYLGRSPQARLQRAMAQFAARAEHELADLRGAIAAERPDLLLVDAMAWGAGAVAEADGRPWAQWFPYPLPLPAPGVPPFGPGLKPLGGPVGRLRDGVVGALVNRMMTRAALAPLNDLRARVGLARLPDIGAMYELAPRLLYMTAEPFEYHRSSWPPNIRLIGPCAWDPPADPPAWLDELRRPLVLVSTSSEFQDDGRLVATALEALAEEDVDVIATLPASDQRPSSIPANARVERFAPHGPILRRAACAVTHGGAGITQKALAAGVPVCVVPFGRDQFEVARRVEVAAAGARLPAARLTAERLRRQVRVAMTKRPGAQRIAAAFAAAGGPPAAADALEELAAERPHRRADAVPATGRG
jgi:UDP:flavonoid glycosyltransferase YjiC (YdhE family)